VLGYAESGQSPLHPLGVGVQRAAGWSVVPAPRSRRRAASRCSAVMRRRWSRRRATRDRHTGTVEELPGDELRTSPTLSLVNESDVAERALGFVEQQGASFRRLTSACTPVLSPAVAADARRVFGFDPSGAG
jgi:hypothetical protein